MVRRPPIAILAVLMIILWGCGNPPASSTQPSAAPLTTGSTASSTNPASTMTSTTSTTTTATLPPAATTRPSSTTSTLPPVSADADSVTLLVIGDFGSGASTEDHVAAAMADVAMTRSIDAFVTTGDNLYKNDVDSTWDQPFGWVDRVGIPVFAAWGNHDVASEARAKAVQEALDPPGDWYWVRIGPANLVVLDGNEPTNPDQLDWLDQTLPDLPPGPTLVSFHQPAYSCASHGSTRAIDENWVPRFEQTGVDLVLNGHDHDYQRFEVSGITYVVTGAGGRGLYAVGSCPRGTPDPIASNDSDHSFVVITLSADHIHAQVIASDGQSLDDFSLATN